jgi:hypothetical protein
MRFGILTNPESATPTGLSLTKPSVSALARSVIACGGGGFCLSDSQLLDVLPNLVNFNTSQRTLGFV